LLTFVTYCVLFNYSSIVGVLFILKNCFYTSSIVYMLTVVERSLLEIIRKLFRLFKTLLEKVSGSGVNSLSGNPIFVDLCCYLCCHLLRLTDIEHCNL